MIVIKVFRLPELIDGCIVGIACTPEGRVLLTHHSTSAKMLKPAMGIDTINQHHRYDRIYGRGEWVLQWVEIPVKDLVCRDAMRSVRESLGIHDEPPIEMEDEKTADDLWGSDESSAEINGVGIEKLPPESDKTFDTTNLS